MKDKRQTVTLWKTVPLVSPHLSTGRYGNGRCPWSVTTRDLVREVFD